MTQDPKGTGYNILIVDDDPIVLEVTADVVSKVEHSVVRQASTGKQGLEAFLAGDIHHVITDNLMPDGNGDEMLAGIKASLKDRGLPESYFTNIPVILVTGNAADAAQINRYRGLVDVVLAKPYRVQQLLEVVETFRVDPEKYGGKKCLVLPSKRISG